ncbi:MAG: T9SS type A sorting domain-containing protein, partial [candidate division Zixibacteria bacterium]|nr:T9SS type A sorting domain-containing protein [candidate division Zixibacteria bacterium]
MEKEAHTRLEVFNILGQKAETLIDKRVERGEHTVTWSASKYSSGIYFYKLSVQGQSEVRRMVY